MEETGLLPPRRYTFLPFSLLTLPKPLGFLLKVRSSFFFGANAWRVFREAAFSDVGHSVLDSAFPKTIPFSS